MDIVIIRTPKGSPTTKDPHPSEYLYLDYFEDLGVSYLAAFCNEKGIENKIVDLEYKRATEVEIAQEAFKENCHLYAISVHAYDFVKVALRIALEIKKIDKEAIIILGGHPITDMDLQLMEMFKFIDYICRGEGEKTFPQLVMAILEHQELSNICGVTYRDKSEIIRNDSNKRIEDLDLIPFPYRYIYENKDIVKPYYGMVYGSRGCYGNCAMCSVRAFYKEECHWIPRSAKNVVDEIKDVYNNYGVQIFSLIDSDFIGPGQIGKERANQIADLIIEEKIDIKFDIACRVNCVEEELFAKLKKAGLYKVFLGVESGCDKVLKMLRKGTTAEMNRKAVTILKKIGIQMEVGFIMIFPDTTLEEIKANLEFIKELEIFQPYRLGSRLYTNPGFEITNELEKDNIVYGNILEKRYIISNHEVKQYFELWAELYDYVLILINKINLFQLHVLWDDIYHKKMCEMNKDILFFLIDILEKGIIFIEKGELTKLIIDGYKCDVQEYVKEKTNLLYEYYKNINCHLPQYSWIQREVSL